MKEIGERLSSVEEQVQALGQVAGQLKQMAEMIQDAQAASAA